MNYQQLKEVLALSFSEATNIMKYTLNRRCLDGRISWRCNYRSCSGRITTQDEGLISCYNNHNHPTQDHAEVEAKKVISSSRKKLSLKVNGHKLLVVSDSY